MPIKKIPSSDVEMGMYVSRLDRPWVETPFMFQGFEIQSEQDLEEVKRLTSYVYIIVADEEIELKHSSPDQDLKSDARPKLARPGKLEKNNTLSIDEEIEKIRSSHDSVVDLFDEVRELVQSGGSLRMEAFEQPVKSMVSSVVKNPDAYLWLTRLKKFDSFLYKDSLTASILATALGRHIGLPEEALHDLATGCMLMDVGKLSLPNELLNKPGRLDLDEWELMKSHVELGVDLLDAAPSCRPMVREIVYTHHERLDGCGYPKGLSGNQISMYGQISGIVDQYVAVTSPRPYAKAISPSRAEEMLYNQRGKQFDEILVEYFIRTLCAYPTGSLVELSTGEVAIVKAQKSGLQLKPDVILMLDPDKKPYGTYTLMALDNYTKDNLPVTIQRSLADGEYGISIEELAL